MIAAIGVWRILPRTKHYIMAHCVSESANGAGRLCRPSIEMHAYAAEVVTETRLQPGTCFRIERLSGRVQDVVNDLVQTIRRVTLFGEICLLPRGRTLQLRTVFAALITLAAARAVTAASTLALQMK